MINKNYAGLDGFVWWMGSVENREDPLGLGRCQVRIYSWHSSDLSDIPSEDLPWAHPVHALNTGTFTTPKEADLVFGFFADGKNAQVPIMLGIMPNFQINPPEAGQGFNDVRSPQKIAQSPKKVVDRKYNTDGTGVTITEVDLSDDDAVERLRYPQSEQINNSSITGLSRNHLESNDVISYRNNKPYKFVKTANEEYFNQPRPAYAPKYPFNQALETESGHSFEFDDTPGNERITLSHRTGSFVEYYPSGTKVEEITKNNYKIVLSDDHIHIMGKAFLSFDSDVYLKVNGDVFVEAGNDLTAKVSGKMDLSVGEGLNIKAKSLNIEVAEDSTLVSGGTQYFTSGNDIHAVSENDTRFSSGGNFDVLSQSTANIEADDEVNLIATLVNINSGGAAMQADSGEVTGIDSPAERQTKNDNPKSVDGPTNFEIISYDDDFEKPKEDVDKVLADYGLDGEKYGATEGESSTPFAGGAPKVVSCGSVILKDDYKSVKLSDNFTLAQMTSGGSRKLQDQFGVTADEILCNLVKLSENILEPIRAAGIDFTISSAFRRSGDVPASSNKSDHYFGRAVDINVRGMSSYDAAVKIYSLVGNITKQFLLEYQGSSAAGWIHLAYDDGKKHALPLATFNNHRVYAANKLVNLRPS